MKNIFKKKAKVCFIASLGNLKAGEKVASFSQDGLVFSLLMPFDGELVSVFISEDQVIEGSVIVAAISSGTLDLDLSELKREFDEKLWNITVAAHAVSKGLMGYLGGGGNITKKVIGIKTELHPEKGYSFLIDEIVSKLKSERLCNGDILVFSEKIFAISQGRFTSYAKIIKNDPKKIGRESRKNIAEQMQEQLGFSVTEQDLICADSYFAKDGSENATLGVLNPNKIAFELAFKIKENLGLSVDVIISDTDTGIDARTQLIECITIGATPIGATNGLILYECMRATLAAEFTRGSDRGIPIVVCRPNHRHSLRKNIGGFRGYDGLLSYKKERKITFC